MNNSEKAESDHSSRDNEDDGYRPVPGGPAPPAVEQHYLFPEFLFLRLPWLCFYFPGCLRVASDAAVNAAHCPMANIIRSR